MIILELETYLDIDIMKKTESYFIIFCHTSHSNSSECDREICNLRSYLHTQIYSPAISPTANISIALSNTGGSIIHFNLILSRKVSVLNA